MPSLREIDLFENDSCYSFESPFPSYDFSDNILITDNTSPNKLINSPKHRCLKNQNPRYKRFHGHLDKLRIPSHDLARDKLNFDETHRRIISGSWGCLNAIASPRTFKRLKLWFSSFSSAGNQNDAPVHVPMDFVKREMIGQQKKQELEREVNVLHKMLAHEQKVHEYLDGFRTRKHGSAINVPSFLPPKMKELLVELSMVENEIARLEFQISQLQPDVQQEKEAKITNSSVFIKEPSDKAAFETNKAFHFINKAMKLDYNPSFNEVRQNPRRFSSPKENNFQEDRVAGIMKPSSPLSETIRHSTCRRDHRNLNSTEFPPKVLATPLHSDEERIQRWAPNKLSENIMKCLISIYIRLLRTSRAMELEKSGPTTHSRNFFSSFREATSLSSKAGHMLQKGSRQQDPYGIFDSEESIPRDIGPYKNLARFTSSSMDVKCIQNSNLLRLFQKLKLLMDGLHNVDLSTLSHQQKLAFWINMYNACIMHGFLRYGVSPVFGHENILALIKKATLNIAGYTISAHAIEKFILRKPDDLLIKEILSKSFKDDNEMILVGELFGLEKPNPSVTFALCCGTRSSPSVKIYTAEGITSELEKSKLEYLQAAIIVTSSKRLAIPELLLRHMNYFARDKDALIKWICYQLPTSGPLRKSIVDCFRGSVHGNSITAVVEKTPYDFEFQYLLSV